MSASSEATSERAGHTARFFFEQRHDDGLTGYRALAVTWVLLFHLFEMVGPKVIAIHPFGIEVRLHPLITCGWVGANLFFVLSGFLLMNRLLERLAVQEPKAAVREYLAARVRRVFPAYWGQIVILLLVALVTTRALPDWTRFLPLHLFMLHGASEEASFAINPVFWTLPIEFGFYLVLPLLAPVLVRAELRGGNGKWRTLAFLVLGTVAACWTYRYVALRLYPGARVNTIIWALGQIPGAIDEFVIGGAAGVALRWTRPAWSAWTLVRRNAVSTILCVTGLAGIVGMMYFLDAIYDIYWIGHWALYVWYSITALFISLSLAAIVISSPLARALFANRLAVALGTISYSVYLWHFPVGLWVMHSVNMSGITLSQFLLYAVPPIIVVSTASYWLLERPFLARSQRERM